MIEYRGEIITELGKGWYWNSIAWPQLEFLKAVIDNKIEMKL